MKGISKLILVNLLVVIILLGILEIIFRILDFGYGNSPLDSDRIMHHVHPKNYAFSSYNPNNEYGGFKIFYDEYGNRINPHDSSKNKGEVWFLGDSFTEALQVEWDSSFVGRVGTLSNNRTVNFGTSSYSPLLYVIQLRSLLQKSAVKPKFVFIQLYNNDVTDDESYAKEARYDGNNFPVACDGGKSNYVLSMLRKLYVMRVIRKAYHTIEYLLTKKSKKNLVTKSHNEELPEIQNTRFETSVKQLEQILNDNHIEHRFFAIPSKYSSLTGDWNANTFSHSLNAYFKKSGIPFIDMDEAFKSDPLRDKLFFEVDIHLTNRGNAIIANQLNKFISEN
jgi:hypothetical protein